MPRSTALRGRALELKTETSNGFARPRKAVGRGTPSRIFSRSQTLFRTVFSQRSASLRFVAQRGSVDSKRSPGARDVFPSRAWEQGLRGDTAGAIRSGEGVASSTARYAGKLGRREWKGEKASGSRLLSTLTSRIVPCLSPFTKVSFGDFLAVVGKYC